ncbi:hypothetical protein [uncultured Amaricoccus sp.]|uniref:hypothetical protein n=2 Tax=Amaricoccus TaxID=56999 RepID=UPI002626BE6E|nr:hypothetical protein [uncultured Amaricoccus sp.]
MLATIAGAILTWDGLIAVVVASIPVVITAVGFVMKSAIETSTAVLRSSISEVNQSNLRRAEELNRSMLELTQAIDIDLRGRRVVVYEELWKLTSLLPLYPRPNPVTLQTLLTFSESLRNWYFDKGGMYLSERARDAYFGVQEEIQRHVVEADERPLSSDAYEMIRKKCSTLRTELADDLISRRAAPRLSAKAAAP